MYRSYIINQKKMGFKFEFGLGLALDFFEFLGIDSGFQTQPRLKTFFFSSREW